MVEGPKCDGCAKRDSPQILTDAEGNAAQTWILNVGALVITPQEPQLSSRCSAASWRVSNKRRK
jgi:hypothetical protein